ncbi:isochorismate synthase [Flavobacterium album]|uniref:isochorismate synthase n=2 Tax=Flavobacterium album TaxID=2175091 RepID=A0A2S1R2P5_9FLAO|nr:isochorismate synthase [Flavobacterium album]
MHYLEDYSNSGFVFAPFADGKRIFIPENLAEIIVTDSVQGQTVEEPARPYIDKEAQTAFEALVAKSVAAIKTEDFEKLVCSRTEAVPVNNDVITIYTKLFSAYPNAFRYCFYSPETGLWMGATPEQLLKSDGKEIRTVALAGTQTYKETENVVWESKEQQEQQFVTDFILGELEGLVSDISTNGPYTFRAGNIVHIKTDILGKLNNCGDIGKIINALHPTPAVCGLPKKDAQQFLLQNEGYDREYYSGFLGELNTDLATGFPDTDLFVNLRCMKIDGDTARLFIGCGITKDSDPKKEFIETVNKSMTMRRVL